MSSPTIPPLKAWKLGNQTLSDLLQPNKLCNEAGHLQGKEPTKQRASRLGANVALYLSDSYKNSGRKVTYDNFFFSLQLGR